MENAKSFLENAFTTRNTYVSMWKNHVKETRTTSMTSSEAVTRSVR